MKAQRQAQRMRRLARELIVLTRAADTTTLMCGGGGCRGGCRRRGRGFEQDHTKAYRISTAHGL